MDHHAVTNEIREKLEKLENLKRQLEKEIDERTKELDQVKSDAFGIGKQIRDIVARQLIRFTPEIEDAIGNRLYSYARDKEIDNAQDYIDYLKESIGKIRDYISKVNDVIANLQNQQRKMSSELNALNTWLARADELFKR